MNRIVVDNAIPFVDGVFDPFFKEVVFRRGGEISKEDLRNAEALVIRTRTRCDASLLDGTAVQIVATATIGTDHIDSEYCSSRGIAFYSAPGCNAAAVMEYVFAAIGSLEARKGLELKGKTLGVVGVGHVGSLVAGMALERGFRVLLNDPPKEAEVGSGFDFVPLEHLLSNSDIVTVHIPLWPENRDFADGKFFGMMKPGAVFVNASRGEVVDEEALLSSRHKLGAVVLDVWKNEPHINLALLDAADIATPHIAGYSNVGKINGTTAVVRRIGEHFGIPELAAFEIKHSFKPYDIEAYDIMADDAALRADPDKFEHLRSNYHLRG
ncbi:MAG: 4-phosphoerythronate dehydrogenase [Bacteroidales bacterium]|nr:4-phosphoerythronate dehydrogenase [Bacteroidales bacterium]